MSEATDENEVELGIYEINKENNIKQITEVFLYFTEDTKAIQKSLHNTREKLMKTQID